MLAVPGRSGWWALPESRPTAPASPPDAAVLQPPSSLRGSGPDRWVSVVGCAAPGSLRIRSTMEIYASLSFFPALAKPQLLGMLLDMDTRMDRQTERRTGRSKKGGGQKRNVVGQRWRHENGVLMEQKGQNPSIPPCLSLSLQSLPLGMQDVDRSLQTAAFFKERRKTRPQSQADGLRAAKPKRRVGKLDCWEVFRGTRWSGPGFRGEPRTQRQGFPEVHYPVTLCLSLRAGSPVISPEAL